MFRRQRRHPDSIELGGLEDLQRAVEANVAAAQSAADTAARAVELLQGLREHSADSSPRRFQILLVTCISLAVAIIVLSWLVGPAFADPAPSSNTPGVVQVLVEAPQAKDPVLDAALREVVISVETDEDGGHGAYTISMPAELKGRRFTVMLAGSATLAESPPVVYDKFEVQSAKCSGDDLVPNEYLVDVPCQAFSATVGGEFKGLLQSCREENASDPTAEYFDFLLFGTTGAQSQIDWAHKATTIPDLFGATSHERTTIWSDMELDRPMRGAIGRGCQTLQFDDARTRHETSISPTSSWVSGFGWGPSWLASGGVVVSETRRAPVIGNLGLAVIGLLGALVIGSIPVTYEAWRSHRRYRATQRDIPS